MNDQTHTPRPSRTTRGLARRIPRRPGLAAGAAAAVALATVGTLLSTGASASPHHEDARPTIVLVHGAWADAGSWNGEVRLLQAKGYTVDVAPNPLRGVADDTAYLESYLATISGPIVLVGHSYGGFVITNAATGNPAVKALVYVDAFAPDRGESIIDLTKGSGSVLEPALGDPASVFALRPFPGAPQGVADAYVRPEVFVPGFAGDLPRAEAAALAAQQSPLATSTIQEASGEPAWKTIPSWAVVGTEDRVIPQAGQLAMAHRAGAHVTTVRGSHLTLVSHPKKVVDVIVEAAEATR